MCIDWLFMFLFLKSEVSLFLPLNDWSVEGWAEWWDLCFCFVAGLVGGGVVLKGTWSPLLSPRHLLSSLSNTQPKIGIGRVPSQYPYDAPTREREGGRVVAQGFAEGCC